MKQRSLFYFSRSERNKRCLQAMSLDQQPLITKFFPILNEVECLKIEIENLKIQLRSAMNFKETGKEERCFTGLLQDLFECAIQNQDKKPKGRRYTIERLRKLCVLFYLLGGAQLYELFAANLIIPSLSLVKTILLSSHVKREGEFRFDSLKKFLTSRGAPLEVFISEDATRITGRILYHPSTNQIVGFVLGLNADGVPIVGSFPATSAEVMAKYFKDSETSNNAYVIMAQPLSSDAPPYCLSIFGTNNKFKSSDVVKRWSWMVAEAEKHGIRIAGFAADGDPKLMSAMRFTSFVPSPKSPWKWFYANLISAQVHFQDFVHLLVKLRTRLLKPSIILPMGPHFLASKGQLTELINNVKKDVHELARSYMDNKDKMNFRSAEKICSVKVVSALERNIARSEGTIVYLNMMRETFLACSDPGLSPLQRIDIMREWVIFLRIWGDCVHKHDGYTLSHNFITANSYYCIELNAHALIRSIVCCRDSEQPCLFKPWLCSSQPCESCFRKARSMTSTFMTQINFSILELLYRMRRIDYLSESYVTLRDKYNFPREQRAFEAVKNAEFACISLPENIDIEFTVQAAFKRANATAMKLKLISKPLNHIPPPVFSLSTSSLNFSEESTNLDDDDDMEIDSCLVETGEFPVCDPDPDRDCDDVHLDVDEDMCLSQLDQSGLRSFNNVEVAPTSPLVKVPTINGDQRIIKKSSYCWFLSNGHTKLSNDRLQRVQSADVRHKQSTSGPSAVEENEDIAVGQWCAFVSEEKKVVFGRIMAFSFLGGSTWKNQEYSGNSAAINHQGERGIGCLCSWFSYKSVGKNIVLQDLCMDLQGYYNIEHYICTVPRPVLGRDGKLVISCSLKDILQLAKGKLAK